MSNSYYQLLRGSRLVALPQAIEKRAIEKYYPTHQIIRSPPSSHFRGNWGLKRDLPQVKSSYISIDSLDTLEHQTPFESENNKFNFLERWKEMRICLYTIKLQDNEVKGIKGSKRIYKAPFSPFSQIKNTTKDALYKNISEMSFQEFKKYIKKLKTKKQNFLDFIEQEQKRSLEEHKQPEKLAFFKSLGLQKTHLIINKYIEKFLRIPINNQKISKTYPNAGLDYYPYGYLSPIVESNGSRKKLLPARILSMKTGERKVLLGGIVASVVGKNIMPNFINGIKTVREGIVNVTPDFAQITPEGKLKVCVKFADITKNHRSFVHKGFQKISQNTI